MILDKIVTDNRIEIEARKRITPMAKIRRMALDQPLPVDLASALSGKGVKLIAEIKRASPSRGIICHNFDPVGIAKTYVSNGASAISVVTEPKYFQGNLDYLKEIRETLGDHRVPLLRKDFVVDPYQVYETRAYGADSLLLIVAILTPRRLDELLNLSHELDMNCLVEVHNKAEIEIALKSSAKIIGINNRNLNNFTIDITTTESLKPLIPFDRIVVSESGIRNRNDMNKIRQWGVDAVLVGEVLMSAPNIATKMKDFL